MKILKLSLIALFASLTACNAGVNISNTAPLEEWIVNGTRDPQILNLTEGQKLAVGYLADTGGSPFCTGTFITTSMIVTAKHCTDGNGPEDILFGAGLMPNNPDALFPVIEIYEHPSVDFAMLALGADAADVLPDLTPIAINREAVDNDWIGRWVEASGYGNTYSNDTGRFFAKVQVYDYDTSIVSVDGHGEQGICYGDSGGPIIWQATPESDPVVVGTEQWGDPSCVDQDHLTRLDYVANFVDATIAAAPAPTLVQCTGDISRAGECDGDVARWCGDAGYERSIDCGATDQKCGYRGSNLGYDCLPSSCGEIDFGGECQDNEMLAWCGSYGLIYTDCDSYHLSCIPRVGDIPGFECGGSTQCGGVPTDLDTSLEHCGDCDTACAPAHANGECNDGECSIKSCKDDYADTDKDIENGCEVDEGCAAFPTTTWAALLGFAVLLRRFRKRER